MKLSRGKLWAIFGAVVALLVGHMVDGRQHELSLFEWLTNWMFDYNPDPQSYSWIMWVAAGAVLGGLGYTLLNRDDKQP